MKNEKTLKDLLSAHQQMEIIRDKIRNPKVSDKQKNALLVRFQKVADDFTDKVKKATEELACEVQDHWFITWDELIQACRSHSCKTKQIISSDEIDKSVGFACLCCDYTFSIKSSDFKKTTLYKITAADRLKMAESFNK